MATKTRTKRRALRPAQIAKAVDEGREALDLYLDEISRVALLTRDEEPILVPVPGGTGEDLAGSPRLIGTPLYLAPEIFAGQSASV